MSKLLIKNYKEECFVIESDSILCVRFTNKEHFGLAIYFKNDINPLNIAFGSAENREKAILSICTNSSYKEDVNE